jgi:hypothetical protein
MELPYFCTISTAGALFLFIIWTWRRSEDLVTRRLEVLFFFSVFVGLVEAATWLYSPSPIPRPLLAKPSVESDQSERDVFSTKLAGDQNASEPSLSGPALTDALSQDDLSGLDRWTAVYDISAHAVYLPNGEALEAHSGLGPRLDDPRYVHERMRGATPPHVYELTLREKPFHGVRALRLTPIGGKEHIFGRSGLLAHTYMLGPKGHSNGCVVFKDYHAFLRAFESGEVKRLLVMARIE